MDSNIVRFNKDGGRYISEKSKITGLSLDSTFISVNPDSVQSLNVFKFDAYNAAGNDLLAIGGILVVTILIIIASFSLNISSPISF
ncbi:MAG: hypothetical protein V1773_15250 [bacterium]